MTGQGWTRQVRAAQDKEKQCKARKAIVKQRGAGQCSVSKEMESMARGTAQIKKRGSARQKGAKHCKAK